MARVVSCVSALCTLLAACGADPAPPPAAPVRPPLTADDALELLAPVRARAEAAEGRAGEPIGPAPRPPDEASVVFAARLIDEQFRPVSSGSLVLVRAGEHGPEEVARAGSDANGSVWLSVALSALPEGDSVLMAEAPGFAAATVVAEPPRGPMGGLVGLGEIRLTPGAVSAPAR